MLALLFVLAAAPISSLSDAQLDDKLAELHKVLNFGDRIAAASALFVGTPYVEHPLGEGGDGPEPQARWRLDGVDCQTFVETVLALANAKTTEQAKKVLDDIRYATQPPSFATRNHFTEAQWLPQNIEKGYLRDEVPSIDGHAPGAVLDLHRAQWSALPGLKRLIPAKIPEGRFPVRYLTPAALEKHKGSLESGSVILVIRDADPKKIVRTSHMGFLLQGPHGWFVRHATSGPEHAVINEPLEAYLQRMNGMKSWKVIGFGLAMPLDAQVRAAGMK